MNESVSLRPLVLLVDDCGDVRDLYELLLTAEFDVCTASRGEEAIEVAATERPQIVVLDIGMPGLDGLETCRRLKADPSTAGIPVVMITGGDYVVADALVAGAVAVLEKPCPDRRLVETIAAVLRGDPLGGAA